MKNPKSSSSTKEILLTVGIVAVAVVALSFVVLSLHKSTGQHGLRGELIHKEFIPLKETQISIGTQGLHKREKDGEYNFKVRVSETGREYIISVDPVVYRQYKVGDTYFFTRPPEDPAPDPETP